MPRGERAVFLLHGIRSRGEWYDSVQSVLQPHFAVKPLLYTYYLQWGALKTLFDPRVLAIGGCAITAIGLVGFHLFQLSTQAVSVGVGTIAIIASVVLASKRRRASVRDLSRALDGQRRKPHFIAHSFGTYLCGHALQRFPAIQLGRLVFVGCVLPRTFPWRRVLLGNPQAFDSVRNEVGRLDWVAGLTGITGRIVPHFGSAGVDGFVVDQGMVHDQENCYGPCGACHRDPEAVVHNVPLEESDHSDPFANRDHAFRFWLPFLWGIPPDEFDLFHRLCIVATACEREGNRKELAVFETELRERPWTWLQGDTIADEMRSQLSSRHEHSGISEILDAKVARAIRLLWHVVDRVHPQGGPASQGVTRRHLRRLHPRAAITAAVDACCS